MGSHYAPIYQENAGRGGQSGNFGEYSGPGQCAPSFSDYTPPGGHHGMHGHPTHHPGGAHALDEMRGQPLTQADYPLSQKLATESEAAQATHDLQEHYGPPASDRDNYSTVMNLSFDLVLARGASVAEFTITPDMLRHLITSEMTRAGADWVHQHPRHLLQHAFVTGHRICVSSSVQSSSAARQPLLLFSNLTTLNCERHYSHRWRSGGSDRHADVMLVHPGHEPRVTACSTSMTHFHTNPEHKARAFIAHQSTLFEVSAKTAGLENFYIFRRGSIYDQTLEEALKATTHEEMYRNLEYLYDEARQQRHASLISHTAETKSLHLGEFRIMPASLFKAKVAPLVLAKTNGDPLAMLGKGLCIYMTTDHMTPEQIMHVLKTGKSDGTHASAVSEHHVHVNLQIDVVYPLADVE